MESLVKQSKDLNVIGYHGLNVIHRAFQTDGKITGWNFHAVLHLFYKLFKDSPASREVYRRITFSDKLPLKFRAT